MINKLNYIETTEGQKYPIIFNINVMEAIQEEYGSMAKWSELIHEAEANIKALKFGLKEMINEAIDMENDGKEEKQEFIDSKKIGRIITSIGAANIAAALRQTVVESTKTGEEPKNM